VRAIFSVFATTPGWSGARFTGQPWMKSPSFTICPRSEWAELDGEMPPEFNATLYRWEQNYFLKIVSAESWVE
jgi:hypothetical protein